jgi:pyruvate/2-oxoglutarate dehydrogenase complex dihydrolipoamide acyltransferase (E2) component
MPLFRRPDGDLVRDESPVRRIMPYLMRTRNESVVYHDTTYRIAAARAWLRAYNRAHQPRATLFHLLAYACAVVLEARPRLNRFISGGRIYQRRGVAISFVAKKEFTDAGAGVTVKVPLTPGQPFRPFSERISGLVNEARQIERRVDQEVGLIMRLPGPVITGLVALARGLDRWNLFPWFMIKDDPMYASLFLANLGSVGVSDAYHHLFEYGTVSLFGAVSAPRPHPFVEKDRVVVDDGLSVRWSFDERIDDAYSCARSLLLVQQILEDPTRHLGPPQGEPAWSGAGGSSRMAG